MTSKLTPGGLESIDRFRGLLKCAWFLVVFILFFLNSFIADRGEVSVEQCYSVIECPVRILLQGSRCSRMEVGFVRLCYAVSTTTDRKFVLYVFEMA